MLSELRVENLLLMERAELRLGPGLNVLTGETGAGKTLLAQALDLLLGGRARSGIVRAGAAEAYVEGVFELTDELTAIVAERLPEGAEELVLSRRVWPDGRTRAYLCGRTATVAELRELGARLLSFYGQHEHRKLMVTTAQLEALDAFVGPEQLRLRTAVSCAHDRVRALGAELEELEGVLGERERELDLLGFELREIEQADPSAEEERELASELERLRHLDTLQGSALAAADALAPEDGAGVVSRLTDAVAALERAVAVDAGLAASVERLQSLRYEAEDVAAELRTYLGGLEAQPGRLEFVEERLTALQRLARKYGGTIAEVLAHAERCRARRAELEGAESTLADLRAGLEAATDERDQLARQLSEHRARAAPRLAAAVRGRLAELAMADARFEVELHARDGGCGPRGWDTVEFLIAGGEGLPLAPLREVASGGELSRVMLALLSVAHGAGAVPGQPLLVFDEIDAGIGGHTARAVGAHLHELAAGRQVLCITHLPQVAATADRHFTIVKDGSRRPALTTVSELSGDGVVSELVRMLGADDGDRAARGHARELLRAA